MLEFILPAVQAMGNIAGPLIGQERQAKHNKNLAEWQHNKNLELLKFQLDYNSPAAQMKRFEEAGLNPHLVYSQGTSGNMQSAPSAPSIQPTDMRLPSLNMLQMAQQVEQIQLMQTQADLNKVKAGESTASAQLKAVQTQLVKANPYLNEGYMNSLISQMESKAKILHGEGTASKMLFQYTDVKGNEAMAIPAIMKAEQQAQQLSNMYKLNTVDNKIKAEILQSKEFQNDLDKVWNDFLKQPNLDGDTINRMLIMLITKLFK